MGEDPAREIDEPGRELEAEEPVRVRAEREETADVDEPAREAEEAVRSRCRVSPSCLLGT